MANEKRLLKVFLCHAKADKQKVRELYRYLHRRRIKPWLDEVDLVGGQDWQVEIPKALLTSDAIIICLSNNSVDKEGYIQKEIKFALDKALEMPEGRIFIIPVRFEECEVPFLLSRYQWVDLFDEAGYTRMMRALKLRASQLERAGVEISPKGSEEGEKPEIGYPSHENEDVKNFKKNIKEGSGKVILESQEIDVVKNINEKKEFKGIELPESPETKTQVDQTTIRRSGLAKPSSNSGLSPLVFFLGSIVLIAIFLALCLFSVWGIPQMLSYFPITRASSTSAGATASTNIINKKTVTPTRAVPTKTLMPTSVSINNSPTSKAADVNALDFFVEEFEADYNPDNWKSFTLGNGSNSNLVIKQEDDHLLFDLGDKNLYAYFMYTPYTYKDVSLKLNSMNRGRNNNNISLICRMDSDASQWYEFSVESGGLWFLYAKDDTYKVIDNGGTNALNQGQALNNYQMDCNNDEITIYVNGTLLKTIKETKYNFKDGNVGFNVSSLNVLPVTVEVNSFEIVQP